MRELNQNQLILLTLLVSFVTSIATGIMTVTLLQQAPVEITRNINNVVEKTIEKVVPSSITSGLKETTTVVVKEEDLIISSINKNVKSIVRIKEINSLGLDSFYGLGIVVSKDGIIGADRKTISAGSIYTATFDDNAEYKIIPMGVDKKTNSIFFKVNLPEKTKYEFVSAKIASNDLQLGQTVIGLGGEIQNKVAVGRVSSFLMKESGTGTSTIKYISGIETDLSPKELISGSPFFNLSGDFVGMKLSLENSGTFTPVSIIYKEFDSISR
jgi:S1-C subfamily serine protease